MKRLLRFAPCLALIVGVIIYQAVGPDARAQSGSLPDAQPVIKLVVEGTAQEGVEGSSCWPKPDNTAPCRFVDDPEAAEAIPVRLGETVAFVIEPNTPEPTAFSVTLPDEAAPGGPVVVRDLLDTDGDFVIEGLEIGSHRVQVVAAYPGAPAGGEYYIEYWFLLDVQPAATPTPTATATEPPTETPIPPTPTETVTETLVPPTGTPTEPPTETAAATITPTFDSADLSPTAPMRISPTPQPEGSETPTATGVAPVEQATQTPEPPPPSPVADSPGLTQTAALLNTVFAIQTQNAQIIGAMTETAIAGTAGPTATPSALPTFTPTAGDVTGSTETPTIFVPTALPTNTPPGPTQEILPTATPQDVGIAPTPTLFIPTLEAEPFGIFLPANVPNLTLNVNGFEYSPMGYSACVPDLITGIQACTSGPLSADPNRVTATPNIVGVFTFAGSFPQSFTVRLFSADARTLQSTLGLPAANVAQYVLPVLPGTYYLAVDVVWPEGTATYFFRLSVVG